MTTTSNTRRNSSVYSSSNNNSRRSSGNPIVMHSTSFPSSSASSTMTVNHRNDSHQSIAAAAAVATAEEGGGGGVRSLSAAAAGNQSLVMRAFAFGSFDETTTTTTSTAAADEGLGKGDVASSLQDFHAKIYDPMQPQPPSSSSSSSPPVLPLHAWVAAVNQFALEEVVDFAEHIGAYIQAADRDLSPTDVKKKHDSSSGSSGSGVVATDGSDSQGAVSSVGSDSDKGRCVDICRESISWAAIGGYDHPQPGSRLMQYAMGWMPDKSVNPSVIYAEGLTKATSGYNANAANHDSSMGQATKPLPEPSLEVARYLKEGQVNKVIVGHQPRGDAPLILDLGTGVQVTDRPPTSLSYISLPLT